MNNKLVVNNNAAGHDYRPPTLDVHLVTVETGFADSGTVVPPFVDGEEI